jgi:hypothetical protein
VLNCRGRGTGGKLARPGVSREITVARSPAEEAEPIDAGRGGADRLNSVCVHGSCSRGALLIRFSRARCGPSLPLSPSPSPPSSPRLPPRSLSCSAFRIRQVGPATVVRQRAPGAGPLRTFTSPFEFLADSSPLATSIHILSISFF